MARNLGLLQLKTGALKSTRSEKGFRNIISNVAKY
jgi:hypothetical protein